MTRGVGIPGAEGPAGVRSRATLLAFARVVAETAGPDVAARIERRLEVLSQTMRGLRALERDTEKRAELEERSRGYDRARAAMAAARRAGRA